MAVIGAGVAGCAAAAELSEAGIAVRLFDKGRVIGGRLAAKRLETPVGTVSGSIGAQYASAEGEEFAGRLAALARAGH
ncbi:MAG: NAD(P)-binding protein, partial [Thermaurantiacus sp.]